jgi:hypothetical protein
VPCCKSILTAREHWFCRNVFNRCQVEFYLNRFIHRRSWQHNHQIIQQRNYFFSLRWLWRKIIHGTTTWVHLPWQFKVSMLHWQIIIWLALVLMRLEQNLQKKTHIAQPQTNPSWPLHLHCYWWAHSYSSYIYWQCHHLQYELRINWWCPLLYAEYL